MATSATHLLTRYSYPKVPGDSPWSVIDVSGPASYVAVLPGPPPEPPPPDPDPEAEAAVAAPTSLGGGQTVTAQDFGLRSLDWVGAMASDDGSYAVNVVPGDWSLGSQLDSIILLWFDANAGTEVAAGTDLSGSSVRLLAIGR